MLDSSEREDLRSKPGRSSTKVSRTVAIVSLMVAVLGVITLYDRTPTPTTTTGLLSAPREPPTSVPPPLEDAVDALGRPSTAGLGSLGTTGLEPSNLRLVALPNDVQGLVGDGYGTLWWTASWGLGRFEPGSQVASTYTAGDDQFFADLAGFAAARQGGVWLAGGDSTLRRFDGETFLEVIESPEPLCEIVDSPDLGVWALGCDPAGWLYVWDGDSWAPEPTGRPSPGAANLTLDGEGHIWVASKATSGSSDHGVARFDGSDWTVFRKTSGLPSDNIRLISGDVEGEVWVVTYSGVGRFDGATWSPWPPRNDDGQAARWRGLTSIVGFDGDVWATRAFGSPTLVRLGEPADDGYHGAADEFSNLAVAGGRLWVGIDGRLHVLDGGEWSEAPEATGSLLPSWDTDAWQISGTSRGHAWLLTNGVGWSCNAAMGCTRIPDVPLVDLVVDWNGGLWALTPEGLFRFEAGEWLSVVPMSAWDDVEEEEQDRDDE